MDSETGYYYLQSRYYDSVIGRFISIDGTLGSIGNALESNLFIYGLNNPVINTDHSGYSSFSVFTYGYIHRKVQRYLADMYQLSDQVLVHYIINIGHKKKNIGFVDLVDLKTGEMWEIKHFNEAILELAVKQLFKYINAEFINGLESGVNPSPGRPLGFGGVPDPTYYITYLDGPRPGIILYHFSKKILNYNLAYVAIGVVSVFVISKFMHGASSGITELEPAY